MSLNEHECTVVCQAIIFTMICIQTLSHMYKQFIVVTEAVEHCKSTLLISVNPMPYSLMLDSASNRIVPGPF